MPSLGRPLCYPRLAAEKIDGLTLLCGQAQDDFPRFDAGQAVGKRAVCEAAGGEQYACTVGKEQVSLLKQGVQSGVALCVTGYFGVRRENDGGVC